MLVSLNIVFSLSHSTFQVEEKPAASGDESEPEGEGSAYNSSGEGGGGGLAVASSSSSSVADIDAFADSLGVACVVCKSFDVQTGNTLVECQDCHSLYHQDCHRYKKYGDSPLQLCIILLHYGPGHAAKIQGEKRIQNFSSGNG